MRKILFLIAIFFSLNADVVSSASSFSHGGSFGFGNSNDICNSDMTKKLVDDELQKLKGFGEVMLSAVASETRKPDEKKGIQIILSLVRNLSYSYEAKQLERFDDGVTCEITSIRFKSRDDAEIAIGGNLLQELKKIDPDNFEGAVFHIVDLKSTPRLYNPLLENFGQEMLRWVILEFLLWNSKI